MFPLLSKCFGYEKQCDINESISKRIQCTKSEDVKTFFNETDFGYVKKRINTMDIPEANSNSAEENTQNDQQIKQQQQQQQQHQHGNGEDKREKTNIIPCSSTNGRDNMVACNLSISCFMDRQQ